MDTPNFSAPRVMAVLNVTPDSFSDGGRFVRPTDALRRAEALVRDGADMIDVGGESTRPGATPVSTAQELERVMPVIEEIIRHFDTPVSVDTSSPELMRLAIEAGVAMINDVRSFTREGAIEAVSKAPVDLCVMHMQGEPQTMQDSPAYSDVTEEVLEYLRSRVAALKAAGVAEERVFVDPGFGFGKSVADNYRLLAHLARFRETGCEILVGLSRKRMIGAVTGRKVDDRDTASAVAAAFAAAHGAAIIRTHNVAATRDAIAIAGALFSQGKG